MKKLLILLSFIAIFSCSHQDQKIIFDFAFDGGKSNIGNNAKIDVKVFDNRSEANFIGSKEFCDNEKIGITSEQNLAQLLEDEIVDELQRKGFQRGNDKIIEVHIQKLKYKANCGFLLGKSNAHIIVKVVAINSRTGIKITKNFEASNNGKHFIIPSSATDAEIINNLIGDVANNIIEDDIVLREAK